MGTLNQGNIHQFVIKQKNTEDNLVSDTTKTTTNKVIQLFSEDSSKSSNEDSIVSNNKKALGKQIIHRFKISQGGLTDIINIGLSMEEIESSELPTLEDVAREKYISKCLRGLDSSVFNIGEEVDFTLLGMETEDGFRPEKLTILKEM